jgi:hypothetical protein
MFEWRVGLMRLVALLVGSFDVAQDDKGKWEKVYKKWKPFALAHDCGRLWGPLIGKNGEIFFVRRERKYENCAWT